MFKQLEIDVPTSLPTSKALIEALGAPLATAPGELPGSSGALGAAGISRDPLEDLIRESEAIKRRWKLEEEREGSAAPWIAEARGRRPDPRRRRRSR